MFHTLGKYINKYLCATFFTQEWKTPPLLFFQKLFWSIPLDSMTETTLMSTPTSWRTSGLGIWLQQSLTSIIGCKKDLLPIMRSWRRKKFLGRIISIGSFSNTLNNCML